MNATSTARRGGTRRGRGRRPRRAARAGSFADRMGLGEALSVAHSVDRRAGPAPRPGQGGRPTALMLAGGGESCADIEHLRLQADLFGSVPSDTTVFRTFHEVTPATRGAIAGRWPRCAHEVWRRSAPRREGSGRPGHRRLPRRDPLRAQDRGRPELQGRLRLSPDVLFRRRHRRGPRGMLRPGNAGANTVADHVGPRPGVGQLPAGSPSATAPVTTPALVNAPWSSGPTRPDAPRGSSACRERNVGFFVTCGRTPGHSGNLRHLGIEEVWHRPSPKTASSETGPQWSSSPRSSTIPNCRRAPG